MCTRQDLCPAEARQEIPPAHAKRLGCAATVVVMNRPGEQNPESIRRDIVTACRVLEAAGQADMVWGHVSVRDPEGRGVWLKGSNLGFDEVGETDVILLGWDGEILEGTAGRHVEYPIHTEIMARRDDVNAVVHTHPLYSIAFAATGWPLKALSHEGSHFVPPDIGRFTRTGDLVRTAELGQALADTLGDRLAVLMPHHGITTAGRNVGEAVAAATHLERACQIALLAGENAIPSPDAEALEKRERSARHLAMAWDYLARTARRR
jgi:ribulose-5-phosphate 4-epimerase/fuculose-1-phosphate aldolase